MKHEYPTEICLDCGNKHGKPKGCAVGMWTGKCGWCGKEGSVTSPRDFGYPKFAGIAQLVEQPPCKQ